MKLKELSKNELISISGGHEGFFYRLGQAYMEVTLTGLGVLAGIWEGITEE